MEPFNFGGPLPLLGVKWLTQFTNHKMYYERTSYQNVITITCRKKNLPIARTLNLNFNQAFEILKDTLYITLQEGHVFITLHVWHTCNPNKYYISFKRLTFKIRAGLEIKKNSPSQFASNS